MPGDGPFGVSGGIIGVQLELIESAVNIRRGIIAGCLLVYGEVRFPARCTLLRGRLQNQHLSWVG